MKKKLTVCGILALVLIMAAVIVSIPMFSETYDGDWWEADFCLKDSMARKAMMNQSVLVAGGGVWQLSDEAIATNVTVVEEPYYIYEGNTQFTGHPKHTTTFKYSLKDALGGPVVYPWSFLTGINIESD